MATTFANIEQLLVSESNRIGSDIYRKTVDTSPWLKLVKQDAWPDEMGDSVSVLVYERSLPYDTSGPKVTWTGVNQSEGANTGYGGSTGLSYNGVGLDSASALSFPTSPANVIDFGQTLRTYGLQHAALESPEISLNDLRFPMKRKEQLANVMQIMTESTTDVWIQRYRDQYVDQAQNKLLATSSTNTTGLAAGTSDTAITGTIRVLSTGVDTRANSAGTGFAYTDNANGAGAGISGNVGTAGASVTQLTQTILDRVYMDLLRNGAGANAYDRMNGAPVFLAIMSPEASDSLIRANADIRQDFRWSERVNELLAPLGVQRSYRNFHHLVDAFVPRYNLVSNVWTRVYPFIRAANASSTAQGFKYELNPKYLLAGYEDTIVFVPEVFTSLVPKPLSVGDGMEFAAQNYRGEFTWRNILDRAKNPDGTVGYFRAIFSNGAKPIFPHMGYVIRHARNTIA